MTNSGSVRGAARAPETGVVRSKKDVAACVPMACVWLVVAGFAVFFSALALAKHAAFQTHGFDLGNYDQTVWNTVRGRLLVCTNWPPFGESRLAFHVEPILLLVAPFYLLHDGPETLLVLQAVVVGLGAWPIAQIARRRLGSPWAGPLFAAVYLLFPALEAGPTFEFHAVTLAATFLAMAFHCVEERRFRGFVIWGVLASACKEEVSLLVAMMGLYVALRQKRWKLGLVTAAVAAAWFLVAVQVILPYFNPTGESAHLGRYGYLGDSVPGILTNVLRSPALLWEAIGEPSRLAYLWRIPFPVGYLALLAPEVLILALPTVAINVLSMFGLMHVLDFVHYSVPVVPFVVIAAIHGSERLMVLAGRLLAKVRRGFLFFVLAGYLAFVSLFYHRVFGHTPLARSFQWPEITAHHRVGLEVLGEIPPDAPVSAQMSLNPHVSQRRWVFVFPEFQQADYIALDVLANRDNEFSLSPPSGDGQIQPRYFNPALAQDEYLRLVRELLDGPGWGVVAAWDGFLVLKRGAPEGTPDDAFYEPFLGCEDGETRRAEVSFGETLELSGVALEADQWGGYTLHTCWAGSALAAPDMHIYVALVDASRVPGEVIDVQELTASVLVPPRLWRSGRPIHDGAFVLFPSDPDRYALGVVVGSDRAPSDIGERQTISAARALDGLHVDAGARVLIVDPGGW